ncbi:hypothetical protein CG471_15995 [Sphingobium sp. IP1]|uniref:hypothetical protein n=1 Tax=Sphingobium sp. IP1 TaxID=2021637 RepID=UPI000C0729A4|nr:hypothetical protein [Sphingobium sp. IP1]PHP18768.1 hypothetical protein CG471_15995 [Sphingobium sp. IP1]
MSRRIRERDLRHDADSFHFGDAMVQCEGYAPSCSEQGRCMMDGRCFLHDAHLVAARMVESLIPTSQHVSGLHLAYPRRVAEMLREGRIYP